MEGGAARRLLRTVSAQWPPGIPPPGHAVCRGIRLGSSRSPRHARTLRGRCGGEYGNRRGAVRCCAERDIGFSERQILEYELAGRLDGQLREDATLASHSKPVLRAALLGRRKAAGAGCRVGWGR